MLPGFIRFTISVVTITGAFRPKTCADVITTSDICTMFGHDFALRRELFFSQRFCIALFGLTSLAQIDSYEPGAQRTYLLFHHRPRVECFHARAEPLCRRDCLQTCHAYADHENARRLDRAGRSHHHWENAVELIGCEDYRVISSEARLRAQRVHFLRDR